MTQVGGITVAYGHSVVEATTTRKVTKWGKPPENYIGIKTLFTIIITAAANLEDKTKKSA